SRPHPSAPYRPRSCASFHGGRSLRCGTNRAERHHPMIGGDAWGAERPSARQVPWRGYGSDCGHEVGPALMIGVIGPADSVRLAGDVARAEAIEQVIARSYESVDQAPALARELDAVCQVILMTGRYSYAM